MERKYYEAYDDRYRQIHEVKLQWFDDGPTNIVQKTIESFGITNKHKLLELGCGEGRDAFPLLNEGYQLKATDISEEAIRYCRNTRPEFASAFQILDCVAGTLPEKFDFIYAVAVIHMLVSEEDRDSFYTFIRNHLTSNGIALICTMGDGVQEWQTDISLAFNLQIRTHEQSGREVKIANTSCRVVSFDTLHNELRRNRLSILEEGIAAELPDFPALMYVIVKEE